MLRRRYFGHLDVEHGHVGVILSNELLGHFAVVRFGDDLEISSTFEKLPDAGADHGVIVGEEDTDQSHEVGVGVG
ncbi:MAG: hypothetical protein Fur0022_00160 [Anaerolineales bacterium]